MFRLEKVGITDSFARFIEFRTNGDVGVALGDSLSAALFEGAKIVEVTGTSKGRGFSGTIKRHGFSRGPETHGSRNHRAPGSIGCSAWPAKVVKGKKMPGRYGNDRNTVRNQEIVDILPEENVILLKGQVPGAKSGIIEIKKPKF